MLSECEGTDLYGDCMLSSSMTTYFNLSISVCPHRDILHRTAAITGSVTVVPDIFSGTDASTVYVESVTRVRVDTPDFSPWISDIRICVPKASYLESCVLDNAVQACPNTGCFDWGNTQSEALEFKTDLMVDGVVTSESRMSEYLFETCRDFRDYSRSNVEKCNRPGFASWCDADGFSFIPSMLLPYIGRYAVVDVKFYGLHCTSGNSTGARRRTDAEPGGHSVGQEHSVERGVSYFVIGTSV